ncbi:MAG: nucleotidyltransferase domain-containing protein [Candidatus Promineifilaceae bacterium]
MSIDQFIDPAIQTIIQAELDQIEQQEQVKILYACESGSRAWGFPSADSDYDVRFFYVRTHDWYLSINVERKRDVIERPINDDLDISGWDLRKALGLFRKSNPPLLEWLGSPIIYREVGNVATQLRELSRTFYNRRACSYHYRHMAQGNFRDHLRGEQVWVKKYFYVLRPILAIRWLEQDLGVVPTKFQDILEQTVQEPTLKSAIMQLIDEKKRGKELARGPRIPVISDFVDVEIKRLSAMNFEYDVEKQPIETLNALFRAAIKEIEDA